MAVGRVQLPLPPDDPEEEGEPIRSQEWGNVVFDQSNICFDSAAHRDAQWPNPHAGAKCFLTDSETPWIYRGGVWHGIPLGHIAYVTGPASQANLGNGGTGNIMSVAFTAVAGRVYQIGTEFAGNRQSGGSLDTMFSLAATAGLAIAPSALFRGTVAAGTLVAASGLSRASATQNGNQTVTLQATVSSGGTVIINPGNCYLQVTDIGS